MSSRSASCKNFKELRDPRISRLANLVNIEEVVNKSGYFCDQQIINRFKQIPSRSIFLTERKNEEFEDDLHIVKYVPEWEGNNQEQRDGFGGLSWNNQQNNAQRFFDIIKNKFL